MSPFRSRNAASFARAQAAYDAMEPPEYYEEPKDEEKPVRVICSRAGEACKGCEHSDEHDRTDDCGSAVCERDGRDVCCEEVEG
jgi:hypothetical protein